MTLEEFGKTVKQSPEVLQHYTPQELSAVPDKVLALKVLHVHPHYWDMISPTARRLYELSREDTKVNYLLPGFLSTSFKNADRQSNIQTFGMEAELLHRMDMLLTAVTSGVPVEALPQLALMEKEQQLKIAMMKEERKHLLESYEIKAKFLNVVKAENASNQRDTSQTHPWRQQRTVLEEDESVSGGAKRRTPGDTRKQDGGSDAARVRRNRKASSA